MIDALQGKRVSAVFITFSGNCRKALTFYQACFGGTLHLDTFEGELIGYADKPVVCGSLASDRIVIWGSDLVHDEGRTLGNYMSIFLQCETPGDRRVLIDKLTAANAKPTIGENNEDALMELVDAFDVPWVLDI